MALAPPTVCVNTIRSFREESFPYSVGSVAPPVITPQNCVTGDGDTEDVTSGSSVSGSTVSGTAAGAAVLPALSAYDANVATPLASIESVPEAVSGDDPTTSRRSAYVPATSAMPAVVAVLLALVTAYRRSA
jgi:hypothetical protein